jgi:hypothetical protein
MKRITLMILGAALTCAAPAHAALPLFDNFENGVGGDIVYAPWGNTSGNATTPNGNNNLVTTDSSHALSGTNSARVHASDPAAWNGYTDFGATAGPVRAQVYIFEDLSNPGTSNPVTNMLSLYGDAGTNNPGSFTDFLQLGVVPFYPAGSTGYGWRTLQNGINNASPATARKQGWTKLVIDADALSAGGQVRFFIDDVLVGTGSRTPGVNLRWVRIGNNSPSYENFWYDDLSVIPEPASLLLLGLGTLALGLIRRR